MPQLGQGRNMYRPGVAAPAAGSQLGYFDPGWGKELQSLGNNQLQELGSQGGLAGLVDALRKGGLGGGGALDPGGAIPMPKLPGGPYRGGGVDPGPGGVRPGYTGDPDPGARLERGGATGSVPGLPGPGRGRPASSGVGGWSADAGPMGPAAVADNARRPPSGTFGGGVSASVPTGNLPGPSTLGGGSSFGAPASFGGSMGGLQGLAGGFGGGRKRPGQAAEAFG